MEQELKSDKQKHQIKKGTKNKKSRYRKIEIVIVCLLLILICMVGVLIFLVINKNPDTRKSTEKHEARVQDDRITEERIEVDSDKIKQSLLEKIALINFYSDSEDSSAKIKEKKYYMTTSDSADFYNNKDLAYTKSKVILFAMDSTSENKEVKCTDISEKFLERYNKIKNNNKSSKKVNICDSSNSEKIIGSVTDFQKRYTQTFGKKDLDIESRIIRTTTGKAYLIDEKDNIIITPNYTPEKAVDSIGFYVDSIKTAGDKYYVTIFANSIRGVDNTKKCQFYSSVKKIKEGKRQETNSTESCAKLEDKAVITDSNKDKLAKEYTFIFHVDAQNNYIYEKTVPKK